MVVIFNLRFEQAVDIDRIISVLKHAARDRKLGKLIIDPSSIAALQDYIHQTTRSPRVSSSGIWPLFSKVAGSGPHKQGISQAAQSQVSRKSKRLIHENVTRSVTRCWDVSLGCLWNENGYYLHCNAYNVDFITRSMPLKLWFHLKVKSGYFLLLR